MKITRINRSDKKEILKLAALSGQRANNLFFNCQMHCSEAVMLSLNNGFGGGLSNEIILGLAAGFPKGVGGSGCICGALSGATMCVGLILKQNANLGRKQIQAATKELYLGFKESFGSSCCRILTKKLTQHSKEHFKKCAEFTSEATRIAAEIILERQPKIIQKADIDYLSQRDSKLDGILNKIRSF